MDTEPIFYHMFGPQLLYNCGGFYFPPARSIITGTEKKIVTFLAAFLHIGGMPKGHHVHERHLTN